MIRIFRYPFVSGDETAKKVLRGMIPALLLLMFSTVPLFVFIGRDSEASRDAVHKITSPETRASVIAVFAAFLLCIVYISFLGIKESVKKRRDFVRWVFYRGRLFYVAAAVPTGRTGSRFGRIMKTQNAASAFLNDSDTLKKLLDGGIQNRRMIIYEAEDPVILRENKKGAKIRLAGGKKALIGRDITDYDQLMSIVRGIQK
ncbi:MAG: hypothetical protein ACI4I9_05095 [Porcipelethomonas sp.]